MRKPYEEFAVPVAVVVIDDGGRILSFETDTRTGARPTVSEFMYVKRAGTLTRNSFIAWRTSVAYCDWRQVRWLGAGLLLSGFFTVPVGWRGDMYVTG
jgi:hypothetical protein